MKKPLLELMVSYFADKDLRPRTVECYRLDLKRYFRECNLEYPEQITARGLQDYLNSMKTKNWSAYHIRRHLMTISSFCEWLVLWADDFGIEFRYNPIRRLKVPKVERQIPRYLQPDEIRRLLNSYKKFPTPRMQRKMKVCLHLMYMTAIRRGGIPQLRFEDINYDTGEIEIHGKGGHNYKVTVPPTLLADLRAYAEAEGRCSGTVFLSTLGKPWERSALRRAFKRAVRYAGIVGRVTPHTIRHTTATWLYRNTKDIIYTKNQLGHRDIGSTQLYAQADGHRRDKTKLLPGFDRRGKG